MGRKGERDRGEIDTDTETDRYGGQKGVEYTHPCSLNRKKSLILRGSKHFFTSSSVLGFTEVS